MEQNADRRRRLLALVIRAKRDVEMYGFPIENEHNGIRLPDDTEHLLVTVDVLDERSYWRSSAAAKKTDADFKIYWPASVPCSPPAASAPSNVTPARQPESTCSRRTHECSV
jgi:hypothetical protein